MIKVSCAIFFQSYSAEESNSKRNNDPAVIKKKLKIRSWKKNKAREPVVNKKNIRSMERIFLFDHGFGYIGKSGEMFNGSFFLQASGQLFGLAVFKNAAIESALRNHLVFPSLNAAVLLFFNATSNLFQN